MTHLNDMKLEGEILKHAALKSEKQKPKRVSPLSIAVFRELYFANLASNLGTQIQVVAAAWLMTSLTSSPLLIALVQTAMTLPVMMFSLFGGAIADNMDRRRLLLMMHVFMLISASILAWVTFMGIITPWVLLGFTFIISMGRALNNPAWHASIRDIVPRQSLGHAVAMNSTNINLARTLGPALGGVIVAVFGVAVAFLTNALSFLVMMVAILRWKRNEEKPTMRAEPILSAMLSGLRYAWRSPFMMAAMARGACSGFAASTVMALMPVLTKQELSGDALLFGVLMAFYGIGAIGGAVIGGIVREKWHMEKVTGLATICMILGLFLLGLSHHYLVAVFGVALSGMGWVLLHSSLNTTVQLASPKWVTARALSLYTTATFAAMVVGSWFFGLVAQKASVYTAFLLAGSFLLLAGIILIKAKLPAIHDLNIDPLDHWVVPDIDVEIDPKEGPIIVELEYRIIDSDIENFLCAMDERERIRRRDGARDWQLWRDLQDAQRWIESYRVPNWTEYVRHNQRRTHADQENSDALMKLNHDRDKSPRVRRYLKGLRRWRIEARKRQMKQATDDMMIPSIDP